MIRCYATSLTGATPLSAGGGCRSALFLHCRLATSFWVLSGQCLFSVFARVCSLESSRRALPDVFPWVSGHMLVKPSGPPDSISLFSRLFRERLSSGSARSCLRLHLTSLTGIPVWTFSRFLVEQSFRQVECFSLPWSAARGSPG